MILPTIHRNGTGAMDLYDQGTAVMDAAIALRKALSEAWPNGRDYYVQEDGAIRKAEDQWRAADESVRQVFLLGEGLAAHAAEAL